MDYGLWITGSIFLVIVFFLFFSHGVRGVSNFTANCLSEIEMKSEFIFVTRVLYF